MNKRGMYTIGLTVLLLGVTLTTYSVWTQSSFSHGEPSFDEGCYCHNNNIEVFVNGTGDGDGGVSFGPFTAGTSFHLLISTGDQFATGVVPGLQEWESNQTNNAKLTFSPTQVTDNSVQDLNKTAGNITALYEVTIPASLAAGYYVLTPYAQGTLVEPIVIQVTSGSTSTTSTTSTTPTSTTTSTTTTKSTRTTTPTTTTSTTTTKSTTTTTPTTTTSTTTTKSTTTTTPTTTTSTTTTIAGSIRFTSLSAGEAFVGPQSYTISGTITPTPSLPDSVFIDVMLQGSSSVLDSSIQAVTASGTFSYTTSVGGTSSWVTGTYVIAAIDSSGARGTVTFEYTAPSTSTTSTKSISSTTTTPTISTATTSTTTTLPVTSTTTSTTTQTITGPTTTVTRAASTITSTTTTTAPPTTRTSTQTTTQTATSTMTQTTSVIPDWAYGVMAVLLLIGLAIGYVVRRPSVKQT